MDKLRDRVAIVTGGARGIGGAIATAFAAEGADVVIADRLDESVAAPVLAAVHEAGRRAIFVPTDISQEDQVNSMVQRAYGEFGEVDILVNNAGIFSQIFFHELTSEDWDRVVNVNLRGCFLCTRAVLPRMLERGRGKIINVASQLGQIGGTEMVHYSASKAGVIGLTKALAREVSAKGMQRQRDRARSDPDRHDGRGDRGVGERETLRSSRWRGSAKPTRLLRPRCSSPPTTRRTTWARRSVPTAAT